MPEPDLRIRTASARDVPVLAELGARTFADTYAHALDHADLGDYVAETYAEAVIAEALNRPGVTYLVATVLGQVAGFAKLVIGSTEAGIEASRPAEVNQLYVVEEMHGRGLGRALLSACVDQARGGGCDVVWLGVWEANPRAIAFYRRFGMNPVGTHEFVFAGQPQTDLLMAISLRSV